jgi:Fe-S-cluster-containing hydrogenase component 2
MTRTSIQSSTTNPLVHKAYDSLSSGTFVKIICGASNNDVALIRNLCFIYTLAGCDCIDMSADEAVINAASNGIQSALEHGSIPLSSKPIVMVSVNDHDDPHFRKAYFNPILCPSDCPRPCERVCPAAAIPSLSTSPIEGVIADKCYGCGRCVPTCPLGLIQTESYTVDRSYIKKLFTSGLAEALEIHTQPGHEEYFEQLWADIGHDVIGHAKIVAVSFPGGGDKTIPFLERLQTAISSSNAWPSYPGVQIWQADGKPMSGDIGRGTARSSCQLGLSILMDASRFKERGASPFSIGGGNRQYVQLAGGTNDYSITVANEIGLTFTTGFGGFAYGGYARKKLCEKLAVIEETSPGAKVENYPGVLKECLEFAKNLIDPVKKSI